ncbi:MAG: DsbA family protein [Thiothrix sp.]|nr:MAG: DsbA family protein [Thiothrix sp.]
MKNLAESPHQSILYYVYDPMCSWCYAFRPIWLQVIEQLPPTIQVQTVLGGLAPDTDQPMPSTTQAMVQANWRKIMELVPSTKFNFEFWTLCQPRRSTYPACRAILAAQTQQPQAGQTMLIAIQNAYYQQARNPSDITTLVELAEELGLDSERFLLDLNSQSIQAQLAADLALADQLGVNSFPSLVLKTQQSLVKIQHSYTDAPAVLRQLS